MCVCVSTAAQLAFFLLSLLSSLKGLPTRLPINVSSLRDKQKKGRGEEEETIIVTCTNWPVCLFTP